MQDINTQIYEYYKFKMTELRCKCEGAIRYIVLINTGSFIGAISFYGRTLQAGSTIDITMPLYMFFLGIVIVGMVIVYEYFSFLYAAHRFKVESTKQEWTKEGFHTMIENSERKGHAIIIPIIGGVASLTCWLIGMVIIMLKFHHFVTPAV